MVYYDKVNVGKGAGWVVNSSRMSYEHNDERSDRSLQHKE